MRHTEDRLHDLEYRLQVSNNVFENSPVVDYEYYKTENLLILLSAKIGTSYMKSYFRENNIKYIQGGFSYRIAHDYWEEDNTKDEPIGIDKMIANPEIPKLILFRNPRIKLLSGVLQDFNASLVTLGQSIIGARLFQEKYNLPDEFFAMIDGHKDFDIESLMNNHQEIMEQIFIDFFNLGIKDNNLLYQHSKLVCKNIYWFLEAGKIKLGEGDSVVDLDTNGHDIEKILKKYYPESVNKQKHKEYYNSNISEYFIYESHLWGENDMSNTSWFKTMENRLNTDWLFYDLLKRKWERTIL